MTLREGTPGLCDRCPLSSFKKREIDWRLAHIRLDEVEGALAVFADGAEHMLA